MCRLSRLKQTTGKFLKIEHNPGITIRTVEKEVYIGTMMGKYNPSYAYFPPFSFAEHNEKVG